MSYSAAWVLPHTGQGIVSATIVPLHFYYIKDTPTLLPKAVRCTLADAQEVSYAMSIAPDAVKYNGKFGMSLFCMRWHDRLNVGLLLRYTGAEGRR